MLRDNLTSKKYMSIFRLGLIMTLGACSTTHGNIAQSTAPIQYKAQNAAHIKTTSLYAPRSLPTPRDVRLPDIAPQHSLPVPTERQTGPVAAPAPQALATPQAPAYDLSQIDRQLYSHMKVGNTYKVLGKTYTPRHDPDYDQIGTASWYGDKFHGKLTANGETFDKNAYTAAHKTLALNSYAIVTNLETGKSLKVRLNDRGPFVDDRIIDLSEASAKALGITHDGLGRVRVQYAGPADPQNIPLKRAPQIAQNQPVPQAQAQAQAAPKSADNQAYQPLRQLKNGAQNGQTLSPQPQSAPKPLIAIPPIAEAPQVHAGIAQNPQAPNFGTALGQTPPPAPQARAEAQSDRPYDYEPPEGSEVTLTIKGAIHAAGYKQESENTQKPRLIPAVHYEDVSPNTP